MSFRHTCRTGEIQVCVILGDSAVLWIQTVTIKVEIRKISIIYYLIMSGL